MDDNVIVIGAGSFGCSLALSLSSCFLSNVIIWGRKIDSDSFKKDIYDKFSISRLNESQESNLIITSDIEKALSFKGKVLLALPAASLTDFFSFYGDFFNSNHCVIICSKGFEVNSGAFLESFVSDFLPDTPVSVMSGPMFAQEVAHCLPSSFVVASKNKDLNIYLSNFFNQYEYFSVNYSFDVTGVQLSGIMKNVIAVASGFLHKQGLNSRAALITKGVAELKSLGDVIGCDSDTFDLVSGIGDMILTCTDNKSRNRQFGILLANNLSPEEALSEIGFVVEGYKSVDFIYNLSLKYNIDLKIVSEIYHLLYSSKSTIDVTNSLLQQ